ncbi:MAG: 16S rRNA (uracil(1498)-N(3))-methyltransferase [Pseudomonadales bacterium]|nr:16S rRNA (uracil(1498)-N(3))-methyltransferase [Pseudomonadales bacterium]
MTQKTPKHRIFTDAVLEVGSQVTLSTDRTHYVTRVLRLKNAAQLVCFNGNGHSYLARVTISSNKQTILTIETQIDYQEKQSEKLHLVYSLTKRPETILQKVTELGVTDIWPIKSQRSEARLSKQSLDKKYHHWRGTISSACEQSGRNRIPELHRLLNFSQFLEHLPCPSGYILIPGANTFRPPSIPCETFLMIGPEGGWTVEENTKAKAANIQAAGLGQNILRADTAPTAALAILQHTWNWKVS